MPSESQAAWIANSQLNVHISMLGEKIKKISDIVLKKKKKTTGISTHLRLNKLNIMQKGSWVLWIVKLMIHRRANVCLC